jgi:hypothetical protein
MSHAHHLPARQTKPLAAHFTDPFIYLNISWSAPSRERAQKLCEMICFILHMPLPNEASTSSTPIPVDSDRLLAALYPRPDFVRDMERIMVTTEASKMVVGYALYYVHLFRRSPETAVLAPYLDLRRIMSPRLSSPPGVSSAFRVKAVGARAMGTGPDLDVKPVDSL